MSSSKQVANGDAHMSSDGTTPTPTGMISPQDQEVLLGPVTPTFEPPPLLSPATSGSRSVASPRLESKNTFVFPIRSVFNSSEGSSITKSPTPKADSPKQSTVKHGSPEQSPEAEVPEGLTNSIHDMLSHPERHRTFSRPVGAAKATLSHRRPAPLEVSSDQPYSAAPSASLGGPAKPMPADGVAPKPPKQSRSLTAVRAEHERQRIAKNSRTELEPDDAGITNLVHDFTGIVRLGDAPGRQQMTDGSSTMGTLAGQGTGVSSRDNNTARPVASSTTSNVRGMNSGAAQMRAQTRKSVRDFVLDQANTVTIDDPNAASPSPIPESMRTTRANTASASSSSGETRSLTSAGDSSSNLDDSDGIPLDTPQPTSSRLRPSWMDQSSDSDDIQIRVSDIASSRDARGLSDDKSAEVSESGVIAEEPITTNRFEYIATEDNHQILIGREQKFLRCKDEPITAPGAVQGFGVLILLEENYDTGNLTVRQVSENSTELLGLSPRYLFRLQCFSHILTREQEDILRDNIENLALPEGGSMSDLSANYDGPTVFQLSGFGEPGSDDSWDGQSSDISESHRRREWSCWVAASRPRTDKWKKVDDEGNPITLPELIILELELEQDEYNPLIHPAESFDFSDSMTPESDSILASDKASPYMAAGDPQHGSFSSNGTRSRPGSVAGAAGVGRRASSSLGGYASQDGDVSSASGMASGGSGMRGSLLPQGGGIPALNALPSGQMGSLPSGSGPSGSDPSGSGPSGSTPHTSDQHQSSQSFRSSKSSRSVRSGVEGIEIDHPLETILESTTNHAKPLRALMGLRRNTSTPAMWSRTSEETSSSGRGSGRSRQRRSSRRSGTPRSGTEPLDVFAVLHQINSQLSKAKDLSAFLKITVGVVKEVCQFHRVLIYRFDDEWNGKVIEELVDWDQTNDLYKGLLFPASDIPPQARELYKTDRVRFLYDRSQMTARLVLRDKSDLDYPLDMTNCFLRAMSPIHLKYLANMGVRSSMSISIMGFGQLWGLIACHSYGQHGMRVSFPLRQMLRLLSDLVSRNVERLSYAQRLQTRKLVHTHGITGLQDLNRPAGGRGGKSTITDASSQASSSSYMISNADELLNIFDADAGLLVINDGCKLLGQNDQAHAMLAIAEYLRIVKYDNIKSTNSISRDIPDLSLPRAVDTISGLLYVPLTAEAPGRDFIVFLRKGQIHEVKWAGKPYKSETDGIQASLEPRTSFKIWREQVTGKARPWTEDQVDSANVLGLIYGKFIAVWRERQSAMASNQLTAILLSNTSHAVRTPLSQVINTLELALAGNIDPDTRSMLENSHQASRALLFHVHDLLDLTRIETGNETAFNDPFDLRLTIINTVRLYQTETNRRGIEFKVNLADDLPPMVIGDSGKIKTLISNLVANAVKYTTNGQIEVACHHEADVTAKPGTANIEIVVQDTGCGIPADKLKAMFVTLEGAEDRNESGGVGLGLAVVARIVEQCEGQLRAESEVGKGTTFCFTVNLKVYGDFHAILGRDSIRGTTISPAQSAAGSSKRGTRVSLNRAAVVKSPDKWKLPPLIDGDTTESSSMPEVIEPHSPGHESPPVADKRPLLITDSPPKPPLRVKVGPAGETHLRVLVVEDDPVNMQILTRRMKMDKHTVLQAQNGQEAVDLLSKDWDIDAIIMDIQMPIMDGYEAARTIRKMEASPDEPTDIEPVRIDGRIPIFALSASLYEADRSRLAEHFDGWLLKPLNISRLRAILRGLMSSEARNAELYRTGHWEAGGYFRGDHQPGATPNEAGKSPQ